MVLTASQRQNTLVYFHINVFWLLNHLSIQPYPNAPDNGWSNQCSNVAFNKFNCSNKSPVLILRGQRTSKQEIKSWEHKLCHLIMQYYRRLSREEVSTTCDHHLGSTNLSLLHVRYIFPIQKHSAKLSLDK